MYKRQGPEHLGTLREEMASQQGLSLASLFLGPSFEVNCYVLTDTLIWEPQETHIHRRTFNLKSEGLGIVTFL